MSAGATTGHIDSTSSPAGETPRSTRILRLWPAILLLIGFWVFLLYNYNADMPMGTRFISRMLAFAVLLLGFLGWWLTRSAVRWRDRWQAVAAVVLILIAASLVADKTVNMFALVLLSLPFIFTVWTIWLYASQSLAPMSKRVGFVLTMLLTIGYFDLLRWDGLEATQKPELSWRWIPTKEASFLASHKGAEKPPAVQAEAKPWKPQPGDYLEYRGPNRDGIVTGVSLATDWQTHPPKLLWRKKVGPGWSGMIVVDNHVVTQEQRGEVEVVSCYDANTGDEIWAHEDPVRFEEALAALAPAARRRFRTASSIHTARKGSSIA